MAGSVEFIQESLAGGEISPRLRGRVRSELYGKSVAYSRNWIHLPQGSIRMRAGSVLAGEEEAAPRLIPFRVSGTADDYVLALTAGKLRIYSRATGALVAITPNMIVNGRFDSSLTGWTVTVATVEQSLGAAKFSDPNPGDITYARMGQAVVTQAGQTYRLTFRTRWDYNASPNDDPEVVAFRVYIDGVSTDVTQHKAWKSTSMDFVAADASTLIEFEVRVTGINVGWLDDVTLAHVGAGTVDELVAPWTADQLAAIQYDGEPVQNRVVLVHPEVAPQVGSFIAPAFWEITPAPFIVPPPEWTAGSWPAVVEAGFQGRLWFGGPRNDPHTFWGSRSGKAFDFTFGADPDHAVSWIVSTKGALRWMKGQKALLIGSEAGEHAALGAAGVITQSDIDIRDESGFGSAAVQALHIGDQVLFVTRDRRHVRALDYSLERNGWVSRSLMFLAEHLTAAKIKEIHFAKAPEQILVALLDDGAITAITYDRAEEVMAGWRIDVGAPVSSACIADGADGSELWLAVTRTIGGVPRYYVERVPLHEAGVVYVDSAKSGVIAADGTLGGLNHLAGQTVRVIVRGALWPDQVVSAGGIVQAVTAEDLVDDPTLVGAAVIVGLAYRARAVTLPPEGGNPRGTSQRSKRRWASLFVRVNESAPPLVNSERPPDRNPESPMDAIEPLFTGDFGAFSSDWGDGSITIEQDLPFRTEILAFFGSLQQAEV